MDIVERLRKHEIQWSICDEEAQELRSHVLKTDAEIERLRKALNKIGLATSVYALNNIPDIVSEIARSALQQKDTE